MFVEAIKRAHGREPRVRGVIAGGGPLLDAIRSSGSASDGVHVLGERSDVPDLMNCADVVSLSSDVEGIPLAAIEAMALESTSDRNGRRWHARGRQHSDRSSRAARRPGVVLAGHPRARRSPRERESRWELEGRARFVAEFTAELMVERYARLLDEVLSARQRAPSDAVTSSG